VSGVHRKEEEITKWGLFLNQYIFNKLYSYDNNNFTIRYTIKEVGPGSGSLLTCCFELLKHIYTVGAFVTVDARK